jgi:hypothetical protein
VGPTVPSGVAAAVEGTWSLGDGYRVQISRSGSGLHVRQQADVRLRGRLVREAEGSYDARSGTVQFPGIGAVHPTIVMLQLAGEGLDYAMSSEVSPGKWTHSSWQPARRA